MQVDDLGFRCKLCNYDFSFSTWAIRISHSDAVEQVKSQFWCLIFIYISNMSQQYSSCRHIFLFLIIIVILILHMLNVDCRLQRSIPIVNLNQKVVNNDYWSRQYDCKPHVFMWTLQRLFEDLKARFQDPKAFSTWYRGPPSFLLSSRTIGPDSISLVL